MGTGRLAVYALAFALLVSFVSFSGPLAAQPAPDSGQAGASGLENALRRAVGAGPSLRLSRDSRSGQVRFVGADKANPIAITASDPSAGPARDEGEAVARRFLASYGPLFGLSDEARQLQTQKVKRADADRSVIRFQQVHGKVPVLGGELIVQTGKGSTVLSAGGKVAAAVAVDTTPQIAATLASENALAAVAKAHGASVESLAAGAPQLWIYNPSLLGSGPDRNFLVWRLEVTATNLAPIRELVLVDALTGHIALHFNQVDTLKHLQTYTANGGETLPGDLLLDTNDAALTTPDTDANDAHRFASLTYDYYQQTHGRDSIDGDGMPIVSTVHYCPAEPCPYQNAGWNGAQMLYGDGFAAADDVVAHEITHGVTQYESNLFYYMQSGAINESLSDIWGELIDQANGAGNDSADVRWQMGEDLGWVFRDMANPPAGSPPQPDRMGSHLYQCGSIDNGGVHYNSGVGNKAAYLMVDGGDFNGKTVTALGPEKTAKIFYEAQTSLLTSAGDYLDLYNALQQSCSTLVGTAGITQANCVAVKNALDAVEMSAQPAACEALEAPICDGGQSPTDLFFDNMENTNSGNWLFGTGNWGYVTGYATSGATSLYGDDPGTPMDASVALAPSKAITLPSGSSYLHFRHMYDYESDLAGTYDGGMLEYSADGSAFSDITLLPNLSPINGYTGTIDATYDNPLGGRNAFVADSHGYGSSRFNLSYLAGKTVQLRFRMGTDGYYMPSNSLTDLGWLIDDIRIYTCAGTAVTPSATAITPTATTVTPTATATVPSGASSRAYIPLVVKGQPYDYFDDFSNPTSGWPSGVDPFYYGYAGGQYVIQPSTFGMLSAVIAPLVTGNSYTLEVDVNPAPYTWGGILFDMVDDQRFYTVEIYNGEPDDTWWLYRYDYGEWKSIPVTGSPEISLSGNNRLRLVRNGVQIAIYVNGSLVGTAVDGTYAGANRGAGFFAVSALEGTSSAVRFDNIGALGTVLLPTQGVTANAAAVTPGQFTLELPSRPGRR